MQEKIKILTIGDHKDSTLENYFKDNENIEFLELALNENIEKLNNKLSNRNVVFLRSNKNNFETLLEIGKALKKKGIITVTVLEEKLAIENKEILEKSFNTIFPVTKKGDIENLLLELLKTIDNIVFGVCWINLDIEDVKNMLEDSGIAIFGTFNKNEGKSEKELVKSITYPFYNKTLKDSKKLLIHLDTLEDVGLAESQVIIEALRDKSEKEMEDILFSLRIDTHLKNRIECSFIAGKFRVIYS
ncbi:cell division protein FtsZ [Fusobacterium polymorphum]